MTCYRCNVEWCWICHRVTPNYSKHFRANNLFGCWGMQDTPQSVCLWLLILIGYFLITPFMTLHVVAYKFGKCFRGIGEDAVVITMVLYMLIGVPFTLAATLLILPVVLIYRLYIMINIMMRHFVCCCCC